jgi:hypothetical protein
VSSNVGKIHVLSTQAATTNFIYLPTAALSRAGAKWEFVSNTTAVTLWNFIVNGTSGQLFGKVGTTAVTVTTAGYENATSGALWVEIVCLSTVLPSYAFSNKMAVESAEGTSQFFNFTVAGSTA